VTINGWTPRNNDRTHRGPVTIREAFARSINTISAKLGEEVGFRSIADMAQRFGITTPDQHAALRWCWGHRTSACST
jgi:penicillin-binding protein 1A